MSSHALRNAKTSIHSNDEFDGWYHTQLLGVPIYYYGQRALAAWAVWTIIVVI